MGVCTQAIVADIEKSIGSRSVVANGETTRLEPGQLVGERNCWLVVLNALRSLPSLKLGKKIPAKVRIVERRGRCVVGTLTNCGRKSTTEPSEDGEEPPHAFDLPLVILDVGSIE